MKRILAIIMSLTMAAAAVPCNVTADSPVMIGTYAAEQTEHIWDGTADTDWYYAEHQTAMVGDQEWSYYEISTPEQLAGLAKLVRNGNSMEHTSIVLTSDIVLNDTSNYANWKTEPPANNWVPIGARPEDSPSFDNSIFNNYVDSGVVGYKGIFDGGGHTIKGLYCHHDSIGGLFGLCSGAVTRVCVENGYIQVDTSAGTSWSGHAGGIAARSNQAVFNMCEYNGCVGVTRNGYATARSAACSAGGIVGVAEDADAGWLFASLMLLPFGIVINPLLFYEGADTSITRQGIYNCISRCELSTNGGSTGGILGWGNTGEANRRTLIVKNFFHEGTIQPTGMYGGIVGRAYKFSVSNCYYGGSDRGMTVDTAGAMDMEEAFDFAAAGMNKADVVEKLGDCFQYADGDVQLNCNPDYTQPEQPTEESSGETTESTEMTETATPEETTEPLPDIELTAPVPVLPEDVTVSTTETTIYWDAVLNASGYHFQMAYGDDFTDLAINDTLSNPKAPLHMLHYGRSYQFRVRAYANRAEDGKQFCSEWVYGTLTIPDVIDPQLPAPQLTGAKGYWSGDRLGIHWCDRPSISDRIEIEASWNPDMSEPFYTNISSNASNWIVEESVLGDLHGITFYARARRIETIVDKTFCSDWTTLKLTYTAEGELLSEPFTPIEPTEPETTETTEPSEPESTESTEPTTEETEIRKPLAPSVSCYPELSDDGTVNEIVRWNRIDGISGYEYDASIDPDFETSNYHAVFDAEKIDFNWIRLLSPTQGKTYFVRIRTYLETEEGTIYSDYAYAQFDVMAPSDEAEQLAAPLFTSSRLTADDTLYFWWNTVDGADSYQVELSDDPDFADVIFATTREASATAHGYTNLRKDVTYYVRIRAAAAQEDGKICSEYTYLSFMIPSSFVILYGDTDSNEKVDAADAAKILMDAASVGSGNTTALTEMQYMAADIDANFNVNASDAAAILCYAAAVGTGQEFVDIKDFV